MSGEAHKQDCELKALSRLLPQLRRDFPQLPVCLSGDGLYACGRALQLAKDYHCNCVLTFKPGHMPAVWENFQGLLKLCPENTWNALRPKAFTKSTAGSTACRIGMTGDEPGASTPSNARKRGTVKPPRSPGSQTLRSTPIPSMASPRQEDDTAGTLRTKASIAKRTAASTWNTFFSIDPEKLKAYYYLLQIAHMILQLVEAGSLLRNLAAEFGRTPMQLYGSLKNLARRMLEAFRYMILNDQAFDPLHAASIQIRLDSS